jgi:hypothetical protein
VVNTPAHCWLVCPGVWFINYYLMFMPPPIIMDSDGCLNRYFSLLPSLANAQKLGVSSATLQSGSHLVFQSSSSTLIDLVVKIACIILARRQRQWVKLRGRRNLDHTGFIEEYRNDESYKNEYLQLFVLTLQNYDILLKPGRRYVDEDSSNDRM